MEIAMTIHRQNRLLKRIPRNLASPTLEILTYAIVLTMGFAALTSTLPRVQAGDDRQEKIQEAASQSVKAGRVFDAIMKTPDKAIPRDLLARAQAIAVFPEVIKAAFFIGGEGGRGVVIRRTPTGWSDSVFFRAGGGSLGPQVGASATDIVLLFMNDEAVGGLMKDKFELGAEAAVAGGPVGRETSAGTDALMQAEILSYSRSHGLFAGVNLKGVVIRPEDDLNLAVYDKSAHELLDQSEQGANDTAADLPSFSKTVSRYTSNSEADQ
jgi:SH3 domain-containing YSC84-like protein 1